MKYNMTALTDREEETDDSTEETREVIITKPVKMRNIH